jgi:hypothetical protein
MEFIKKMNVMVGESVVIPDGKGGLTVGEIFPDGSSQEIVSAERVKINEIIEAINMFIFYYRGWE